MRRMASRRGGGVSGGLGGVLGWDIAGVSAMVGLVLRGYRFVPTRC